MTRRVWSWSWAGRLVRLPSSVAAVAVAFTVGMVVGPIAVSAQSGSSSQASQSVGSPGGRFHLDHVFVIMMENTSYDDLLSPDNTNTTFIRRLAATEGLADNYFGVTHDSLPNYIAATSGQTWGSNSDDTAQAPLFDHQNLVDQLVAAHVSWKAYMESLPFPGDLVDTTPDGLYVRKHDPFLMYPDVYNNPARADNVVPLTQLSTDLSSGRVPQFVWVSPNICNDMHGGAPTCPYPNSPTDANQAALYKDGDTFLRTWVGAITHSRAWTCHSAIFVTWDEGGFEDRARRAHRHPARAGFPDPARDAGRPHQRRRRRPGRGHRLRRWPRSDDRGSQRRPAPSSTRASPTTTPCCRPSSRTSASHCWATLATPSRWVRSTRCSTRPDEGGSPGTGTVNNPRAAAPVGLVGWPGGIALINIPRVP